ncbi:DUF2267 domain-containing protein [Streptomyces sp. NPDC004111]|uniref:DUF2267 domain-containing protein n=1 Tax=Streptomyces sp. NPDC004111 TaxID=3364690 RepID=UPI0036BF5974
MITDAPAALEHQQPYGAAYGKMLEKVRYEGAYPTRERADEAVRLVLAGLGRQLAGDERVDLATCLPVEAARILASEVPEPRQLTGCGFVEDLAARSGGSLATTRWDASAVFAAVTALVSPGLISRILDQLPAGYALMFGRVELNGAR